MLSKNIMTCLKFSAKSSNFLLNARQKKFSAGISQSLRCFSQNQALNKKFTINSVEEFEQKVIQSNKPIVVNFHAAWSRPCQTLTPQLTNILQNSDKIDLATIDADYNIELIEIFDVKAVPAVVGFRRGVVVDKFIGLVEPSRLETLFTKLKVKDDKSFVQ